MTDRLRRLIALLGVVVLAGCAVASILHVHVADPARSCQHDCDDSPDSSDPSDTPSCCQLVPAHFVSLLGQTRVPVISPREVAFRTADCHGPAGWPDEIDLPPQLS
jgi:hypothetical protein